MHLLGYGDLCEKKKQCKFQRIYCLRGEKNTNQLIVKMPKY